MEPDYKTPSTLTVLELWAMLLGDGDGDVAQLVERSTSTLLLQVEFPDAERNFSPRVNFQCRLSYGVHTSPCAIACVNICVHTKDPVVHVSTIHQEIHQY